MSGRETDAALRPRVLVVDDEPPILRSVGRLLAFLPLDLVFAGNGEEALSLFDGDAFAVVVTDQHMPRMQGVDLLRAVREKSPDTSRILFSGHVDVELIRTAVNAGEVYRFVTKPWNDDELCQAVRNGIERWQLVRQNRALSQQAEEQNALLRGFNAELERMVSARTEALELRHRALALSQEVLDGLPVAVIGLDPGGDVALANALARRAFPGLLPGESAADCLPRELVALARGVAGSEPVDLRCALGPMRFELSRLPERGLVITAVPLPALERQ